MFKFCFKFASVGFIFVVCLVNRLFGVPPKSAGPSSSSGRKNLVVIMDMEPDDLIALEMIHSQLADRVLAIGTTVLNAERKAALVRNALEGTQLEDVKVLVGSGGGENEYPQIMAMANQTDPF
ncbi:hypothetical protein niasHT_025337 [Heterodera trifolii]|uniref:Inosine/uridine-preferring nucleoside hydrolase domain-containing protein n=1 Tax=Heterodera trifolii TaxID=157864 RepID=A0ABD2KKK1_9BILA